MLYDFCKRRANKWLSLSEWKRHDTSSYRVALKNKWQRQIAEELGWKIKVRQSGYSEQDCLEEAEKYQNIKEWSIKHPGTYEAARKKSIIKKIASTLGWKYRAKLNLYDFGGCLEKARPYKSLKEWKEKDKESYYTAVRNKWHRKIAMFLKWKQKKHKGKWTYLKCKNIAAKYSCSSDWSRSEDRPSYITSCQNRWLKQIKEELGWSTWTYETCKEKACAYGSLLEWSKGHKATYLYAVKNKWQRQIGGELGWTFRNKGRCNKASKANTII